MPKTTDEQCNALFEEVDKNDNGKLEFDEFIDYVIPEGRAAEQRRIGVALTVGARLTYPANGLAEWLFGKATCALRTREGCTGDEPAYQLRGFAPKPKVSVELPGGIVQSARNSILPPCLHWIDRGFGREFQNVLITPSAHIFFRQKGGGYREDGRDPFYIELQGAGKLLAIKEVRRRFDPEEWPCNFELTIRGNWEIDGETDGNPFDAEVDAKAFRAFEAGRGANDTWKNCTRRVTIAFEAEPPDNRMDHDVGDERFWADYKKTLHSFIFGVLGDEDENRRATSGFCNDDDDD